MTATQAGLTPGLTPVRPAASTGGAMTDPVPRWIVLPGDPKPLKTWLADRQAQANPETALPADWPENLK